MEVEKQRGISVTSSVMQFEYADHTINLLDTPGHEDFSEDTYRVLTAVDAAVMVIDAAKGVEARTIKLLEVCRLRDTPIITFINKLDREVREPLALLEEVESVLAIDCAPISWPVGMGKRFRGVFDLRDDRLLRFAAGEERLATDTETIEGIDNPRLAELFPDEIGALRHDVELIRTASHPFDLAAFLAGRQTPVFFGSAINNFGVQEVLQALVDWAPPPQPRDATVRDVLPTEKPFSGFVFKIQANMDPRHRDRIAFFRVCSGRYLPAMKVRQVRTGRDLKLANALTFMANERVASEDAVAGDIIGIHNHGQLQIGDTLTEGESLAFRGIPYFAPELFRVARPRDPFKAKPLGKGLQELGEEGAIQVFASTHTNTMLLGAVGPLQFEIVAQRLASEYKVDAVYETANISTARWLTFPDETTRRNFEREQAAALATDVDGNPVFLATNKYNLQVTMERWPKVGFHATREHGERLQKS
jgi:peptide chain release factor 3